MERTKHDKADAIFTADWHLRDDTPTAFKGDFQEEQWKAVDAIARLQQYYDCVVINTGDLFNNWKPSPWLLTMAMRHLPDKFYTIYGNHDLPQHNLELADKCGINVLAQAGKLSILGGTHWGQVPSNGGLLAAHERILLIWHVMTYQGKKPWPSCTDPSSASLLKKYPQFDTIVTGHNHQSFVEEYEGRLLVNPGGITRQSAEQIDFEPRVFLWNAEKNTVRAYPIPYTRGAISREHIDVIEQRDARIDAFISGLNTDWSASLSFEQNLEKFKQSNIVRKSVIDLVYKAIE